MILPAKFPPTRNALTMFGMTWDILINGFELQPASQLSDNRLSVIMTPQELEQYVQLAADASNLQNQQQANSLLLQWVSSSTDAAIADSLLSVIKNTQKEVALFYCLTTFHRLSHTTIEQRAAFRQELLQQLITKNNASCWSPAYIRTKVGVLFTKFIQLDYPHAWPNAFGELKDPSLLQAAPDIFLRTLVALTEEFGKDETVVNWADEHKVVERSKTAAAQGTAFAMAKIQECVRPSIAAIKPTAGSTTRATTQQPKTEIV